MVPPFLYPLISMNKPKLTPSVHIGNLISKVLEEKHISVTELAKQLHTDKSNMYKILRKSHIDTELLCRISQILNHNFFKEYCQHESSFTSHERMELAVIKANATLLENLLSTHDEIEILFKESD